MLDFFNSSLLIAKKEHKCHICGMSISEGEQYSRESGKYDGDFFDRATCKCCYSARDDYFNESGENEYDNWCISDMVRDAVCHKCDRYEECEFADPLWCEDVRKDYIKITEERWNRMENKKMRLYAARDKNTGKLVSGITNPSHKFWQRQGDCESAIRRYNCDRYKRGNYDLELVTYELVEVKEEDKQMVVSKAEYNCLKTMTNDLMEAEYFINNLGVETRTDVEGDTFRNTMDILKDIVTVCNNNPKILEDCAEFLAGNPTTSDESDEFQSRYNLEGIYKIEEK